MGIFLELEKIALAILIWQTLTIFDNIFRNLRVDISCGLSAIRMSGLILHENLKCHKICLVGCTWRFKGWSLYLAPQNKGYEVHVQASR